MATARTAIPLIPGSTSGEPCGFYTLISNGLYILKPTAVADNLDDDDDEVKRPLKFLNTKSISLREKRFKKPADHQMKSI